MLNSTLSSTGAFSIELGYLFCVYVFLCGIGRKKEVILKVDPERSCKEGMGCVRQNVFWFNPFKYEFLSGCGLISWCYSQDKILAYYFLLIY